MNTMNLYEAYEQVHHGVLNKKEKAAICEAFGFPVSNKAAEIEKMILEAIRDERNMKTEYAAEDVRWFGSLEGGSTSYKKLKESFDNEKLEFIKFLKDYWYNSYKIESLRKRYSLSIADKWKISRYEACERYLKESTSEFKNRLERIDSCFNTLVSQLDEFKTKYINKAKEIAEKTWAVKVEKKQTVQKLEDYIKNEIESAERYYTFSLMSLAERLINNGVNEKEIKVKFVGEDMKLFEMILTDGKKTWHGRAIIAAEYSNYVSTHVRFIITSTK